MSAATVSLLFFIYTLLLMLTCALGSSVSLCSYLVTHGKAHLAFTVLFAAYLIEQGVAFSWSYSGFPDLSYETEVIIGAALLLIELAISTVIVASALWAVLEHVGRASRSLVFAPSLALAALQVIGLMAIKDQTTYQWLFYAARTILLIAALVWSFLRGKDNDVNETRHPSNQRRICWIIVALLVNPLHGQRHLRGLRPPSRSTPRLAHPARLRAQPLREHPRHLPCDSGRDARFLDSRAAV